VQSSVKTAPSAASRPRPGPRSRGGECLLHRLSRGGAVLALWPHVSCSLASYSSLPSSCRAASSTSESKSRRPEACRTRSAPLHPPALPVPSHQGARPPWRHWLPQFPRAWTGGYQRSSAINQWRRLAARCLPSYFVLTCLPIGLLLRPSSQEKKKTKSFMMAVHSAKVRAKRLGGTRKSKAEKARYSRDHPPAILEEDEEGWGGQEGGGEGEEEQGYAERLPPPSRARSIVRPGSRVPCLPLDSFLRTDARTRLGCVLGTRGRAGYRAQAPWRQKALIRSANLSSFKSHCGEPRAREGFFST